MDCSPLSAAVYLNKLDFAAVLLPSCSQQTLVEGFQLACTWTRVSIVNLIGNVVDITPQAATTALIGLVQFHDDYNSEAYWEADDESDQHYNAAHGSTIVTILLARGADPTKALAALSIWHDECILDAEGDADWFEDEFRLDMYGLAKLLLAAGASAEPYAFASRNDQGDPDTPALMAWKESIAGWTPLQIAAGCRLPGIIASSLKHGWMDPVRRCPT